MIRIILLAFFLASCGGDDGGSSSSSGAIFSTFKVVDPYIVEAVFFHDVNKNGIYDSGESISTATDKNGDASFPILIPAGEQIIQYKNGITEGFNYPGKLKGLSNGTGDMIIISPLTTLSANDFNDQQIIQLLENVGISITAEEIDQNPMENPTLLQAAVSIAQALLVNAKGFDLTPEDIISSGTVTKFSANYGQELFKQSSIFYDEIISKYDFNNSTDMTNLSKTLSSYQNYINKYGASDFVTPEGTPTDGITNSLEAINNVVASSTSSYQPVALEKSGDNFTAQVVNTSWFSPGSYDLIGIDFLNITTPLANNTIGKYPFSPRRVQVNLFPSQVIDTRLIPNNPNHQMEYKFDSDKNITYFQGSLTQTNGSVPLNVQRINDSSSTYYGLPISTFNDSTTLILRSSGNNQNTSVNEAKLRLVGDGQVLFNYFGVNFDPNDPYNENNWTVDTSRDNNCVTEGVLTKTCDPASVSTSTYFYKSENEYATIKSFNALTAASSIGEDPTNFSFKFSVKNINLKDPSSSQPVEYTISFLNIGTEKAVTPATLTYISTCNVPEECGLKVEDGLLSRNILSDTIDVSFLIGYDQFPADYRVYAINKVSITKKFGGLDITLSCDTSSTSSFYKAGMLIIQFPSFCNDKDEFPMGYIIADLVSRNGVAGSPIKDWVDESNPVAKFKYRDFDMFSLKEVTPP